MTEYTTAELDDIKIQAFDHGCGGCHYILAGLEEREHAWSCPRHIDVPEPTLTVKQQQDRDFKIIAYSAPPVGGWAESQDRWEDHPDNL